MSAESDSILYELGEIKRDIGELDGKMELMIALIDFTNDTEALELMANGIICIDWFGAMFMVSFRLTKLII